MTTEILAASYIALSLLLSLVLFTDIASVPVKRAALRWGFVVGAVVFFGLALSSQVGVVAEVLVSLGVIFIFTVTYTKVRFCDRCGRTAWAGIFQPRASYCKRCGAALVRNSADRG